MQHRWNKAGLLKSALLGAATLGAISLAGAGVARADLVSVGAQIGTGSITTLVDSVSGATVVNYTGSDSFGSTSGTVQASPYLLEPDLSSSNFTVSSNGSNNGSATIYVTEQGVSSPTVPFNINSGFTTNTISGNVKSITESTYVDFTNGLYLNGTPQQIATATFNPPYPQPPNPLPSQTDVNLITPTTTPFSLTEVYTVDFGGAGNTNLTINLRKGNAATKAPEPGSLALLGTGLLGLGLVARRRRRKV